MLVMFVGLYLWNITLQEKYSCNDVAWVDIFKYSPVPASCERGRKVKKNDNRKDK
jgi:hypothetical protein